MSVVFISSGTVPFNPNPVGGYSAGAFQSPLVVTAGDVVVVVTNRRQIGAPPAPIAPTKTGTCTIGALTAISSVAVYDAAGTSRGSAGLFAALVTAPGTLQLSGVGSDVMTCFTKLSGLETTGGTTLLTAFGATNLTNAPAVNTVVATPSAATGGGSALLTICTGGGDATGVYGAGLVTFAVAPPGPIVSANIFSGNTYGQFSAMFASVPYSAAPQTVTPASPGPFTAGGFAVWQLELIAD